jgi:dipeptidyl aminopeptidase/acylaminoacyl peptidase
MRHLICAAILVLVPCLAGAQGPVVPVPPNVKSDGLPPLPQSILDALRPYSEFREAQLVAWHPTKRQIVVATRFGNVPQIHLVDGPGRARTQLTFLSDGVSRLAFGSFDPADGNTLVIRKDAGGGTEATNLYRYDMATGSLSLITDGKSRYGVPVWSRQGGCIAYQSTERNGTDRDLFVMQVADPRSARRLGNTSGTWDVEAWSADAAAVLAVELASNTQSRLWRVDVKSGDMKLVTPRDDAEQAMWSNARFSADGRSVYAISDRVSGHNRLWRGEMATGKWTAVTKDTEVVSAFEISPDGMMAALVLDRGNSDELQVVDLGTLKPRTLPQMPLGLITRLEWRPNSRELGFTYEGNKARGDVYSIDTSIGTMTRWTASEIGPFNPDALPGPELVEWKSFDGRAISGFLYKPPSRFAGPRPVMINIHGGPELRWRPSFVGRSNYFLNELGVAIIYVNVRGSSGFGREFEQLDNGKGREGAIKDIGALLDWIGTRPDLDKDRVMLTGASYGGYLSLEAGIYYNDRIRCIFAGAGIANITTFIEQTGPDRQANRRVEYGDERDPDMRAFQLSISPITRASELKKPVAVLHPGKDTRIPVSQAMEMVNAVKANHTPVWYLEFTDAGHDDFPSTQANNQYMFGYWVLFVKTYLLN